MKNKNKLKPIIIAVACVLFVALAASTMAAIVGFSSIILPGPSDEAEFGGVNLNNTEELYASKVSGLSYNLISGKYEQTTGIDTELLGNFYILPDDGKIIVSEWDTITVDIDITYDSNDTTMFGVLSYSANNKITPSKSGYSKFINLSGRDDGSCVLSVMDGGSQSTLAVVDNSFHLTIVYNFNHSDYTQSSANVYVEGVYVGEIPCFTSSDLYSFNRIRIQQMISNNSWEDDQIGLSNLVVNGFERGYDGAINELLDDTSITLQECSDSILYKN